MMTILTRTGCIGSLLLDGHCELFVSAPSRLVLQRHMEYQNTEGHQHIFRGGWNTFTKSDWRTVTGFCHTSKSWTRALSFQFCDWWNILKSGSYQSNYFQSLLNPLWYRCLRFWDLVLFLTWTGRWKSAMFDSIENPFHCLVKKLLTWACHCDVNQNILCDTFSYSGDACLPNRIFNILEMCFTFTI